MTRPVMTAKEETRPMNIRRLLLGLVPSLCVFALVMLFWGASAQALEVHRFERVFGGAGSGPGELSEPEGVAVNDAIASLAEPAGGDVYVADKGNGRVERFSASGVYLGQFDGDGTYEVVEGGVSKVEHGAAAPTGAIAAPSEIAVDGGEPGFDPSAGDVYVVDRGHGVIDKFSTVGAYMGQLRGTPLVKNAKGETTGGPFEPGQVSQRSIESVAVDPNGTVWVSLFTAGLIYGFSDGVEGGKPVEVRHTFGGIGEGLGVDGEDDLYLNVTGNAYVKIDLAGGVLANPFGGERNAHAIAVDPVGGEVYLDNKTEIEAFSLSGEPIESGQPGALFPSFGSGHLANSRGLAVNAGDGAVYATDKAEDTVSVFEAIVLPGVSIAPVSEQQPRGVTLNGMVDPEGKAVSSCVFEYSSAEEYAASKTYAHSVPCEPSSLGEKNEAVPVHAKIDGLTPGSTYAYRLVAENVGGKSPTANQTLVAGPVLGSEFVTEVTSSSAGLRASIDPNGGETHYYFEYGASEAYGSYAPVPPGTDIGSGLSQQTVSVHLQSLQAGTTYHYRFVAIQDGEVFAEPDHVFTTQGVGASAVLPDDRAWELVSPPKSNGALIELFEHGGQIQAASDGSGIAYQTEGPAVGENPQGNLQATEVLSRRGPEGWSTTNLTLPDTLPENGEPSEATYGVQPEYDLFSPDLSLAVVEPQSVGTPPLAPGVTERTLYLRDDLNATFTPLVSPANVPPGTQIEEPNFNHTEAFAWEMHFLAATPDLAHVVFKTPKALTAEAIDEETIPGTLENHAAAGNEIQWNLYEWGGGKLGLVNILPDGEVAHGRYAEDVPQVRLSGTDSSGGQPAGGVQRVMSSDGERIAWTWGEPYNPQELKTYRGLYVRDMVEERTVKVGGPDAIYQTMDSEGSKIFYLEDGDLYVYDWETETSLDLTANHGAGEVSGGVQESVSDVSEDGSSVYFVATGVLAEGGVRGGNNLYVLHDTGEEWTTAYIATLSAEDIPDWYAEGYAGAPSLARVSSRVSPDGRYLEFMSDWSLTGYDNTDAVSGQPDEEVYLYDAQTGKLVCASCDPTRARPVGVFDDRGSQLLVDRIETWAGDEAPETSHLLAGTRTTHWLAGSVPGWDGRLPQPSTYQPRYLSDNGRLFFDSPVGLVPQDTNGLGDVYEYEPKGVGDCTESTSTGMDVYVASEGGCVGLISSGTSSAESAFYDASENGDDVFFTTTARLSPLDYDKGYDVYDAHVCTSEVPCTQPSISPPPCDEGESCKEAPTPQPEIFGPPPTATFNGAGNAAPAAPMPVLKKKTAKKKAVKCKRGEKRSHGKCLKVKKQANDKRRTKR